jgi:hypothetical protein
VTNDGLVPSVHIPSLAPELQAFPADHRSIWSDRDARRQALEAIIAAWERGASDLGHHVLAAERARFRAVADRVFATERQGDPPRPDAILALWRLALR